MKTLRTPPPRTLKLVVASECTGQLGSPELCRSVNVVQASHVARGGTSSDNTVVSRCHTEYIYRPLPFAHIDSQQADATDGSVHH